MSVSASLDIRFAKEMSAANVVKKLLNSGWRLQDEEGNSMYLPLADRGRYDWQIAAISPEELLKMIRKQEKNDDTVGLSMSWQDSQIGGEFLFLKPQELFVVLSMNRQVITGTRLTDMSWYVERIVLPLEQAGVRMAGFSCQHHE